MAVQTPTTTPAISPATHIVRGGSQSFLLGSTLGSLGVQITDAVAGFTFTDQAGNAVTPGTWYALASVTSIVAFPGATAPLGGTSFALDYALLADGTGPGTPANVLVFVDVAQIGPQMFALNAMRASGDIP